MHKLSLSVNTLIITKDDLPIFCLDGRKLSSPFYGTRHGCILLPCAFLYAAYKKPSGQKRTAAKRNHVA